MNKQDFIEACRTGGSVLQDTLRQLDRSYHVLLLREVLRVVRDQDLAVDVVQETLIKVWRNCASFRGESELLTWIRTILRRTVVDQLRKYQHEVHLDDAQWTHLSDTVAIRDPDSPVSETIAMKEQQAFARGWREFQTNAPEHAAVLGWVVDDGLSISEVAYLLGRSPGATREYISQCRKRARLYLGEWYVLVTAEQQDGA